MPMPLVDALAKLGVKEIEVRPGNFVIEEGAHDNKVFILSKGTAGIMVRNDIIAEVSKTGTVFGEIASICDRQYSASVKTLTTCKFYEIDDFPEFLLAHPQEMFIVLKQLCTKIVATNQAHLRLLD